MYTVNACCEWHHRNGPEVCFVLAFERRPFPPHFKFKPVSSVTLMMFLLSRSLFHSFLGRAPRTQISVGQMSGQKKIIIIKKIGYITKNFTGISTPPYDFSAVKCLMDLKSPAEVSLV